MSIRTHKSLQVGRIDTGLFYDRQAGTLSIKVKGTAVATLADTAAILLAAGAQTISGIKTFSAMPRIPINATVAAAGSVQGDAAALSEGFTVVTGANGTVGVRLPTAVAGAIVIIKGGTSGVLKVWPASGAQINAVTADNAMSLASGLIPAILIAASATQWYTLPLLPS